MTKKPSTQQNHSWGVYLLRATPARLIGIVHDQRNELAAIKHAIEEFRCRRISAGG